MTAARAIPRMVPATPNIIQATSGSAIFIRSRQRLVGITLAAARAA